MYLENYDELKLNRGLEPRLSNAEVMGRKWFSIRLDFLRSVA
jgi:hypothetical protein